jgi:trans-L-3-hydroxyproline dehydratase
MTACTARLLVEPDHPEADLAVLFMHNEGYSTMCGHATIALARWAVESGRVKGPTVRLQCPCGLVVATVAADGRVRFESVPSFAYALDRIAPTATWGPVTVDIAFGGAFYAFLPADSIGLDLRRSAMRAIVDAGEEIAQASPRPCRRTSRRTRSRLPLRHDPDRWRRRQGHAQPQRLHLCRPPNRSQPDRQRRLGADGAAGGAASARLGDQRRFESCTGAAFTGTAVREAPPVGPRKAVIVDVGGVAHVTGEAQFRFDDDDPLREGFALDL